MYLKIQLYRQTFLAVRKHLKLSARYYGPYQVLKKIGAVAYKLSLAPNVQLHSVFCISLFKEKVGERIQINQKLPSFYQEAAIIAPEKVLKFRVILRDGKRVPQGLIKWLNLSDEEATWEDKSFILH